MSDEPTANPFEPGCDSCAERPNDECLSSRRACGHHCNCSRVLGVCCWCGTEFGENTDGPTAEPCPWCGERPATEGSVIDHQCPVAECTFLWKLSRWNARAKVRDALSDAEVVRRLRGIYKDLHEHHDPITSASDIGTLADEIEGKDMPALYTTGLPPDVAETLREDFEGIFGPLGGEDIE